MQSELKDAWCGRMSVRYLPLRFKMALFEDVTATNEELLGFLKSGGIPNPLVKILRRRGQPERTIRDALAEGIVRYELHYASLQPSGARIIRGGREVHEADYLTQIVKALRGDGPVEYESGYNNGTITFPKLR